MIYNSGLIEQKQQTKRVKVKNMAKKGEKKVSIICGAKKRTIENQEEDNLKMCIHDNNSMTVEAEDANFQVAPTIQ